MEAARVSCAGWTERLEEGDGRMDGMRVGGMAGEVLHAHSNEPVLNDAASMGCNCRVFADGLKGGRGKGALDGAAEAEVGSVCLLADRQESIPRTEPKSASLTQAHSA